MTTAQNKRVLVQCESLDSTSSRGKHRAGRECADSIETVSETLGLTPQSTATPLCAYEYIHEIRRPTFSELVA